MIYVTTLKLFENAHVPECRPCNFTELTNINSPDRDEQGLLLRVYTQSCV